jgi:putative membrane protein (TIGR04086 family)
MEEKSISKSEQAPLINNPIDNNNGALIKYCSTCGASVNSSDMYCGNCGFIKEGVKNSSLRNYFNNHNSIYLSDVCDWKTIVIGGVIAFFVSFLLGFFSGIFLWDADIDTILGVALIATIVSWFIGGLYAGVKARNSGGMHGAYAGAICAIISIPLNTILGMPVDILSSIFAIFIAMFFAGIGGLIGYQLTKSNKTQPQINTQTYYG